MGNRTATPPAPDRDATAGRPTLAGILRRFLPGYRQHHRLRQEQRQAARAIQACRTPALGAHEYRCTACGHTETHYHSCRNRHCPVCQRDQRERWLQGQEARLLPVAYFHVVFTIAAELRVVFCYNRRRVIQLLFAASARTLQAVAADPRWLGARLGFFGVLHTWGQRLGVHPHVHYVVPQGGVDSQGRWVPGRGGDQGRFLLPIQALSKVFRGRMLRGLRRLYEAGQLRFPDPLSEADFPRQLQRAASKPWEVYAKPPFAGVERLLAYVGRYTHRVALTPRRLLRVADGQVHFTYRDYRAGGVVRTMALAGEQFVGRFLQHVLPRGVRRIRSYGWMADSDAAATIARLQWRFLQRSRIVLGLLLQQLTALARAVPAPAPLPQCPRCEQSTWRLEVVRPAMAYGSS